jgi:NADPH-ferrihemoprotein reductase
MEHFDLYQIPFEYLFEWIPFLLPRYYTISSSNLVHPQRIHITVSVIKYPITHGNLLFEGVCSSYLERLQPPTNFLEQKLIKKITRPNRPGEQGNKQPRSWPKVCMFVRPSTFRLPSNPSTPIIMIGPGTGIAPMRAFLQERAFQKYQKGIKIGKNILFFGCRYEKQDFLYQEELVKYQKEGVLNELYVAFSRENKKQKIYVQHLLEKQSESIWKLLFEEKAHIYVCGGTNMGNDVHAVLLKIVKQYYHPISHHHDLDGENATTTTTTTTTTTREEEANQYLKSLQTSHRYVQELWA